MHWLRLNGEVIGGIAAEAISPLFGNRLPTTLAELRFILSGNQDCLQGTPGESQIMIESIKVVLRTRSQLCCLDYLLASSPPVPRQENCPPADLMLFLRGGHYKEVSNDRFSTEGCLKSVNVAAQNGLEFKYTTSNDQLYFHYWITLQPGNGFLSPTGSGGNRVGDWIGKIQIYLH